jgi:thiol:disulfide interchange protein
MTLKSIGRIALILTVLSFGFSGNDAYAKEIEWQSFAIGMARGKSENKKIFLHFYAEWCATCKVMKEKTFKDPGVIASLNEDFIPIKVDVDRNKEASAMFKVQLLPDTWFIAGNTKIIGHRPGYITPEQLKVILKMLLDEETGQ